MQLKQLFVALTFIVLAAGAQAQKIGVVDMKAIADKSQRIQADLKKAQAQVQTQQEKLAAKMDQIQKERDDLSAQRSAMTPTEVSSREEKLSTMREEYNDLQNDIQKQISQIQRTVLRPQAEKIQKIIADVARQQGYDLVLDAEAVIFHSDAVDITPLVVQIFDRDAQTGGATGAASEEKPAKPATNATTERKPATRATPHPRKQ